MKASQVLRTAALLIEGEREEIRGRAIEGHRRIAALWNAFLSNRVDPAALLTAAEVAKMMALLKIARTEGGFDADNLIDAAGYLAIALEIETED